VRDLGADPVGTISSQWTGGNNAPGGGDVYAMQNQLFTFQPSSYVIGAPHPYVSKMLAGCHKDTSNPYNNVQVSVTFTPPAYPYCLRYGWYYRFDPGFVFDPQGDQNTKDLCWTDGDSPFQGVDFTYTNWGLRQNNFFAISGITKAANAVITVSTAQAANPFSVGATWEFNSVAGMTQINGLYGTVSAVGGSFGAWTATVNIDSTAFSTYTSGGFANRPYNNTDTTAQYQTDAYAAGMFQGPNDANGHNTTNWNQALMPFNPANGWIRREVEMCITNNTGSTGFMRVYDNGSLIMNYSGKTDNLTSPTTRNIAMGNYSRNRGVLNYRYYCDAYADVSGTGVTGNCAAVYVGNSATWSTCTIREPQIIDSLVDNNASFHFHKGKLQSGFTGYVYVCPESGGQILAGTGLIV
jgi:hypothetical protein